MQIKYFSDDGHQFETQQACENYENALIEIKNINSLPVKEINGKRWYKLESVAEFYFFNHMNDTPQKKSDLSMYEITGIVEKINVDFPYWITNDFEDGIMIDKKRVMIIDETISQLENEIEKFKSEKEQLKQLQSMEVKDSDYKNLIDDKKDTAQKPVNQSDSDTISMDVSYGDKIVIDDIEYDKSDIVGMTFNESGLSIQEWNNLSKQQRNQEIKKQIEDLK